MLVPIFRSPSRHIQIAFFLSTNSENPKGWITEDKGNQQIFTLEKLKTFIFGRHLVFKFVQRNQGGSGMFFFPSNFFYFDTKALNDFQDEITALQPLLWIIFGIFLITDLDSFHRSVCADKGWLVFIDQSVLPVRASGWRCGSVRFQPSLPPFSLSQYWLADADARHCSAEYQCWLHRRSGRFGEPASCSVLNFCVLPESPAAVQEPGATPCQNKLPPASSPRKSNVITQTEKWEQRGSSFISASHCSAAWKSNCKSLRYSVCHSLVMLLTSPKGNGDLFRTFWKVQTLWNCSIICSFFAFLQLDILCNEEILGKDHTLKFVVVTRWRFKVTLCFKKTNIVA